MADIQLPCSLHSEYSTLLAFFLVCAMLCLTLELKHYLTHLFMWLDSSLILALILALLIITLRHYHKLSTMLSATPQGSLLHISHTTISPTLTSTIKKSLCSRTDPSIYDIILSYLLRIYDTGAGDIIDQVFD